MEDLNFAMIVGPLGQLSGYCMKEKRMQQKDIPAQTLA